MNNNKTPDDKPDEVKAPLTKKQVKEFLIFVFVLITLVSFLEYFGLFESNKPDACDCARILNVPTETIGYKEFPIANIGNEEYKKFEECQDEYAGPATAILECAGK